MLRITMLATPRLRSALTVCGCEWKGRCSCLSSTLRVAIVYKYSYRDEVSCDLHVVYVVERQSVREAEKDGVPQIMTLSFDQRVETQPHFPPVILTSRFTLEVRTPKSPR